MDVSRPEKTCPEPGGCDSCPNPLYCAGLRVGTGITTTDQERELIKAHAVAGDGCVKVTHDPIIPSVPSVHELAEAARDLLKAMDDPRHIVSWVDMGEGENVMDRRAHLESVLARV